MDSTAKDGSFENPSSPSPRPVAGTQISIRGAQLVSNTDIVASPPSLSTAVTQPLTSSSNTYSSSTYLNASTVQSAYLRTPVTQPYSPYSGISPPVITSTWSQPGSVSEGSTSSLSRQHQTQGISLRPQPVRSAEMSAVAIQFDPTFNMGPRSAFTWPGPLESHGSNSAVLSSMGQEPDPSLTPPVGTRSLTSSPPRYSLTAEQRELKRQQDKARRDTRLMTRVRRTSSPPYMTSSSPTMSLTDGSNAVALPAYTTSGAPVSLMAETATAMAVSPYLPTYSPSMEDQHQHQHTQSAPVYPAYPQNLQSNYTMPMDYTNVYAGTGHYSTRPTSLPIGQDVGLMYQVPAIMNSGGAGSPEGGHVRVVQSRPKPRCWEHGCNGRQFSTFSNLLRHQREKSGQAAKATCPNCGAEFTRTTARNGHLLHDKCKGRRNN
ncbi:hypothetical protein BGZ63DRAFT_420910 [Mariannaea sp. PMI_226]|nr:hypothetical protein BGZ63DRAFT_420910 [Mariannaea sp. PMI_226]